MLHKKHLRINAELCRNHPIPLTHAKKEKERERERERGQIPTLSLEE
jgi:hypothetical protein